MILILILAAFALRLLELSRQNIWWDEARNIDVALRPFATIATAPELDIQPPLYYWLLHGWLRLAASHIGMEASHIAFIARFLSLFAGVAAIALLFQLTANLGDRLAALAAATFAAGSPFWLAESQETRMYTVGLAWLIAAALALLHIQQTLTIRRQVASSASPPPSLFLFALSSAGALLTHYNALFILVPWFTAWGLWALWQPDRLRQLANMLGAGLLLALLVAPILPIALRQIPDYANPNLVVPSVVNYLGQNWQGHLGGYAFDAALLGGYGQQWLWIVLGAALIGLGGWTQMTLWQGAQQKTQRILPQFDAAAFAGSRLAFLAVWLLGGLALYYSAVVARGAFNIRYSSFVTPALYALLGIAVAGWRRWGKPLALVALGVIGVGFVPAVRADLYDPRFNREDTQGVATWLRQHTQPGDLILLDQKYPFGFYYQRFAIDANVKPQGDEAVDARYLFVDINTLDQRLNGWASQAKRIFWVQWFESDTDPRHAVPFLFNQAGRYGGGQGFQGYSVEWWEFTPPNHFKLAPAMQALAWRFGGAVETVEVSLPAQVTPTTNGVPVAIRWQRQVQGDVVRPLKARVALYNAAGERLSQTDERLLNDRHLAPAHWQQTDRPLNVYWLERPPDLAPSRYDLRLLVYDAESLAPLELYDSEGKPVGQEAPLGQIQIDG
jgi:hypothetical protein